MEINSMNVPVRKSEAIGHNRCEPCGARRGPAAQSGEAKLLASARASRIGRVLGARAAASGDARSDPGGLADPLHEARRDAAGALENLERSLRPDCRSVLRRRPAGYRARLARAHL